ncbi:cytochrome b/b6 domain-containing protein [Comamonas sp. GB3 AK4-5]|uniref:cytochrome b/b6 domain-containing protein n=1 Tax=Comamonas sp. GB3 AK4-5 TaxID=3231487 RepID=UPI00351E1342
MNTSSTRIWDLPTRLFHWLLAASVIALVVTAKMGGNAMEWHLRLGHAVLALLVFRILWGLVGGYWSRFTTFTPSPARLLRYLRGQGTASDRNGHNPLGALSVWGMLLVLGAQAGSGLFSDDDIAFSGPLTRFVSGDTVGWATTWHKEWGQWLLLALIALHLCAVVFYTVVRRQRMVAAMLHGDQPAPAGTRATRDGMVQRLLALGLAALCAAGAWWIYQLAAAPAF